MRSLLAPFLLAPAALLLAPSAHAQFLSVYGTFSPTHLSSVQTGVNSTNQEQYASFWAYGVGGGATVGLIPLGPIRLGADFRGSTKPGTSGADTFLVGLKLGIRLPFINLKPYVQGSVGYLATRTPNFSIAASTFTNQYLAYEIFGGIDYQLVHFVDLRIIEIGGGQGIPIGIGSSPNASLLTVSTGVVLHF